MGHDDERAIALRRRGSCRSDRNFGGGAAREWRLQSKEHRCLKARIVSSTPQIGWTRLAGWAAFQRERPRKRLRVVVVGDPDDVDVAVAVGVVEDLLDGSGAVAEGGVDVEDRLTHVSGRVLASLSGRAHRERSALPSLHVPLEVERLENCVADLTGARHHVIDVACEDRQRYAPRKGYAPTAALIVDAEPSTLRTRLLAPTAPRSLVHHLHCFGCQRDHPVNTVAAALGDHDSIILQPQRVLSGFPPRQRS